MENFKIDLDLDGLSGVKHEQKKGVYSAKNFGDTLRVSLEVERDSKGAHVATHAVISGSTCRDPGRSAYDGPTILSFEDENLGGEVLDRSQEISALADLIESYDPSSLTGGIGYVAPADMFRQSVRLIENPEKKGVFDHVQFRLTANYANESGHVEGRGSKPIVLPLADLKSFAASIRQIADGTATLISGARPLNTVTPGTKVSAVNVALVKHNEKINKAKADLTK